MFDESFRSLPSAEECERSVLSSILKNPEFCLQTAMENGVTEESFHIYPHGLLFGFVKKRWEDDLPCELVELTQALRAEGVLENIGGPSYITQVYTFAPSEAHFSYHLSLLRNAQALRAVIENCTEAVNQAYANGAQGMDVLSEVIGKLERVQNAQDTSGQSKTKPIKDLLTHVLSNIEARTKGEEQEWLPLPWKQVKITRGGCAFIGARPAKGKSAMLMNAAEHLAIEHNEPVCFISLEMDPTQLAERALSTQSMVHTSAAKTLTTHEQLKIKEASIRLAGCPLYISDMPGATADEIIVEMRKVQRLHGVNVFFVDYIQYIGPSTNEEAHRDKLRIDSALMKMDVARKKLGMTHVFAAQLDRDADKMLGREMTMRLLSDTSLLEKIAYQVVMLGDRKDTDPLAEDRLMEANVVKNRCGSSGYFPMVFRKKYTLWEDDSSCVHYE